MAWLPELAHAPSHPGPLSRSSQRACPEPPSRLALPECSPPRAGGSLALPPLSSPASHPHPRPRVGQARLSAPGPCPPRPVLTPQPRPRPGSGPISPAPARGPAHPAVWCVHPCCPTAAQVPGTGLETPGKSFSSSAPLRGALPSAPAVLAGSPPPQLLSTRPHGAICWLTLLHTWARPGPPSRALLPATEPRVSQALPPVPRAPGADPCLPALLAHLPSPAARLAVTCRLTPSHLPAAPLRGSTPRALVSCASEPGSASSGLSCPSPGVSVSPALGPSTNQLDTCSTSARRLAEPLQGHAYRQLPCRPRCSSWPNLPPSIYCPMTALHPSAHLCLIVS